MLKSTVGYPQFDTISPSQHSLVTAGHLKTPDLLKSPSLEYQKTYFDAGFQGLGFTTDTNTINASLANALPDFSTLFSGNMGTYLLIGGAVILGIMLLSSDKRKERSQELKRAKESYKKQTSGIKAKYGKLGLGL